MPRHDHGRSVEELAKRDDPPKPPSDATIAEIMRYRLETKAGKELYGLRKQTVEPAFGIIKDVLEWKLIKVLLRHKPRFMRTVDAAC